MVPDEIHISQARPRIPPSHGKNEREGMAANLAGLTCPENVYESNAGDHEGAEAHEEGAH